MSLPYPTKAVLPFDIATAQDMNERHANDVALADGTGLDDGAVTPAKRSSGFKVGSFSAGGSIGNVSVTGVGFKPKLVELAWILPSSSNMNYADGSMDENGSQWARAGYVVSGGGTTSTIGMTNRCFITPGASGTTREAEFVSMDDDGFTINFTTAATNTDIGYKAYA